MMIKYRWQKNNNRFYQVILQKDLLKDWCLTCIWGSIHSRLGNSKNYIFGNQNEAIGFIEALHGKRVKRGYQLVAS